LTPLHAPVMTAQVLAQLALRPDGCYVDGTLGEGGHSAALLDALGGTGRVIGLDRDPVMLERAQARIGPRGPRFSAVRARFSHLRAVLAALEIERVDGVLLDLGLCSAQLDDDSRGFSFQNCKPSALLDMRMSSGQGESAAELLARLDAEQLSEVLRAGGVPGPRRAAAVLIRRAPRTVGALLEAAGELRLPARRHHPATLLFQALRMAVNDEIGELETALEAARDSLAPGGRLVVLSYHSGEDRRVKQFLAREARGCICPPELPLCGCQRLPTLALRASGEAPDPDEIRANPRARSARLRAGERL
jgi:16S rRNA (cytosine1402-N4)-methyltransferase